MALRSRPISHTARIISSRLTSPFPSLSSTWNTSSASVWRCSHSTSTTSSWYSALRPSITRLNQTRLARASLDARFSSASTTTEWLEVGLKTSLPVTSWAMLPKAAVIWSPTRPAWASSFMGVAAPPVFRWPVAVRPAPATSSGAAWIR